MIKMSASVKDFFSPFVDLVSKLRKYLSDRVLVTDLITKLVITFGVVSLIGGVLLMITGAGASAQTTQSTVSAFNWIPGTPFSMNNLSNSSVSTIGLASWLVGLDLLLVGLGLWVRHKLARLAAMIIFVLAACFQFVQFIRFGALGAPSSVLQLFVDVIFVYFLFSKFDSKTDVNKQLT
jgi:lysylphosphatidylglycerol synthetase-like protein (DUF2156 family)